MAYTYDAGTSTPGYDGLIEIAGTSPVIRLNSASPPDTPSTATFRLTSNPLLETPPVRSIVTPLGADDGGVLGAVFLDSRAFTLPGWLSVPSAPSGVPLAQEQLKQAFAAKKGLLTLIVNALGWATRRQFQAQTVGAITWSLHHSMLMIPTRSFEIPMVAPDPIGYDADNLRTQAVPMTNVNTAVTSAGSEQVGFTARFTGPFTNATLTRVSDGATLVLTGSLTAGQYVDVSTFGMFTAVRDDASNQMGLLTAFKASRIRPGTENWKASAASGTTGASGVTLTWRDGW